MFMCNWIGLPRWFSGKESARQSRRCGFSSSYVPIWVKCGFGRTDAEAEAPVLWPPDAKSQLTGKDPDARTDGRLEEKGPTEEEMVGWHHRLDGHESERAPGVGDGQGGLACCGPRGRRESGTTEHLNRAVALQYAVGFCHKTTWIRCDSPHVPSVLTLPPTPCVPSRLSQSSARAELPGPTQQPPTDPPPRTRLCAHVRATPSALPSLSLPSCVHRSVLYVYISMSRLQTASSKSLFLDSVYVCEHVKFVFLCLTDFTLYNML